MLENPSGRVPGQMNSPVAYFLVRSTKALYLSSYTIPFDEIFRI
jgi:hypothetical protein